MLNDTIRAKYKRNRDEYNQTAAAALKSAKLEQDTGLPKMEDGTQWERNGFVFALELREDDRYIKDLSDEDQNFGKFGYKPTHLYSIKVDPDLAREHELYRITQCGPDDCYYNPDPAIAYIPNRFSVGDRAKGMAKHDLQNFYRQVEYSAYRRHMAWLANEWQYVGFVVTCSAVDGTKLGDASLWGIESDFTQDYGKETAAELQSEAQSEAKALLTSLCEQYAGSIH